MIFKPFQIVSLWDIMEKFQANAFLDVCKTLGIIMGSLAVTKYQNPNCAENAVSMPPIKAQLEWIQMAMAKHNLKLSAIAAKRFLGKLDSMKIDDAHRLSEDLFLRLYDELKDRQLFILPSGNAEFYNIKESFLGKDIIDKFPNATTDAVEAGNCFAVGRYTACVFHLMRIMEDCVQKIGTIITGINTEDKNWYNIIIDVRKKIKAMFPDEKDSERIKWDSALNHLDSVRSAWRNTTMHPKQTYTEEEAEEILNCVKGFTRQLAKII